MKQDTLLRQKIGMRLSRIGSLSKIFAVQTFAKENVEITPEQFSVLMALKDNDGIYQRQLGTITFKDRPNITRIVSILEEKKYITSQIAADGRQVKKLFITQSGLELCDKYIPIILSIWQDSVKEISEEEIDNLLNTIDKIESNLKYKILDRQW
jgi:DNA-binding MarR family transcriptional regulator